MDQKIEKILLDLNINRISVKVAKTKILKLFTPIELPSIEEIEKEAILLKTVSNVPIIHSREYIYWKDGAKWVLEQIKNQQ